MQEFQIALLGCGTVGYGAYRLINQNADMIAGREGVSLKVKYVLVRDASKPRDGVDAGVLVDDIQTIVNDPEIALVAEAMGGTKPAREYALAALRAGKSYVTANKELISKHWPELEEAAQASGAGLYFEASVAGAVPVIKSITDSLQANHILSVMGIINGTTNYILSKMMDEGWDYGEALAKAQALGYAEPDPTNDVEGYDAKYKIAILSSLAFGERVDVQDIYCEGITKVTAQDMQFARELGYVIKLLAIGKKDENGIQASVYPTMVPKGHPLAGVNGPFNAVFVEGSATGELMYYGRGAGDMPTASAVVSDIINALKENAHKRYPYVVNGERAHVKDDWITAFYARMKVEDKPGVLSKVAGIFAKYNVSIRTVVQKGETAEDAALVLVTHRASEKAFRLAMEEITTLEYIRGANIFRVEE